MKRLLEALASVHGRRFALRDVKLDNVFIDALGRPYLADFGFAVLLEEPRLLKKFCGSLLYKAPESVRRVPYCPCKADVPVLGVTFFEMCAGRSLWPRQAPELIQRAIIEGSFIVWDTVERAAADVIRTMLAIDPGTRPAEEVLALSVWQAVAWIGPEPEPAPPAGLPMCAEMELGELERSIYMPVRVAGRARQAANGAERAAQRRARDP